MGWTKDLNEARFLEFRNLPSFWVVQLTNGYYPKKWGDKTTDLQEAYLIEIELLEKEECHHCVPFSYNFCPHCGEDLR